MTSCLRIAAIRAPWALIFLWMMAGCTQPTPPAPPPPTVVVETPTQRDVTNFADFTGNTDAIESVEIRARVQGFLDEIEFTPASFVRQGDLLFVIEREPYIVARDRAEADVRSAEAGLRRAESDLDRLEQAVKTNAVSQQEVTRARAERDQARAGLGASRAVRDNAIIDLDYTEIRSPINGIISRNLVDRGNLVGRTDATLLAAVLAIDPIYVYFEVNEKLVARFLERWGGVGSGQQRDKRANDEREAPRVYVSVDGTDRTFEGQIDYIDPAADSDTGTVQMRAVLPNETGLLLPGFFVRIRVPGETIPGALLVPETALSTDLGGRYLMLVDGESIVQKRYIQPGQLESDNLRVVLDGLETGDRFITEGLQRARPGMPVTVEGR